jgi:hypothetical protein
MAGKFELRHIKGGSTVLDEQIGKDEVIVRELKDAYELRSGNLKGRALSET